MFSQREIHIVLFSKSDIGLFTKKYFALDALSLDWVSEKKTAFSQTIVCHDFRTSYEEEKLTLVITQSLPEDEGEYTIKAINDKGVATSNAEVLIHIEAPVFTQQLEDIVVELSETATFKCTVTGIPTPKVTWYVEDETVKDGPKYSTSYHDNVATLEVKDVSTEDSPIFITCKAVNVAGEARTSAELTVEGIYI